MRGFLTILATFGVIGLGYWAYHQNIQTQVAIREVDRLHRAIGAERERLAMLQDEWAYLTRPDRLRELADLDFDRLQLLPMTPEQFGEAGQIAYPPSQADLLLADDAELLQNSASGPERRP